VPKKSKKNLQQLRQVGIAPRSSIDTPNADIKSQGPTAHEFFEGLAAGSLFKLGRNAIGSKRDS